MRPDANAALTRHSVPCHNTLTANSLLLLIEAAMTQAETRYDGKLPAPQFPDGLDWLNTANSLSWEDLSGKLVVMDFWTYC